MEKWYKYIDGYLSRGVLYQKIYPLRDAAFGADCLTHFQNFEGHNSQSKKSILIIPSRIVTCCNVLDFNLKMKSLHLIMLSRIVTCCKKF